MLNICSQYLLDLLDFAFDFRILLIIKVVYQTNYKLDAQEIIPYPVFVVLKKILVIRDKRMS